MVVSLLYEAARLESPKKAVLVSLVKEGCMKRETSHKMGSRLKSRKFMKKKHIIEFVKRL